jgi:hypothetical protein
VQFSQTFDHFFICEIETRADALVQLGLSFAQSIAAFLFVIDGRGIH